MAFLGTSADISLSNEILWISPHTPYHFLFRVPSSAPSHFLGEVRILHLHKRHRSQQWPVRGCDLSLFELHLAGRWEGVMGVSRTSTGSLIQLKIPEHTPTHTHRAHIHIHGVSVHLNTHRHTQRWSYSPLVQK